MNTVDGDANYWPDDPATAPDQYDFFSGSEPRQAANVRSASFFQVMATQVFCLNLHRAKNADTAYTDTAYTQILHTQILHIYRYCEIPANSIIKLAQRGHFPDLRCCVQYDLQGTTANAQHQQRLRGVERSRTHVPVRETTVENRCAEAGNRLHFSFGEPARSVPTN